MNSTLKLQFVIVITGIFLLIAKFLAFYFTGLNTILTDAMESIVNVVAGFLSLYSLYLSSLPKDLNHPYGHGKVEFISAGIEGTLIALAGVIMIVQSIYALLFQENAPSHVDIGCIVIAVTGMINFILGTISLKKGRKENSLALIASGKHLISDAYSTLGILIGIIFILIAQYYQANYLAHLLDNGIALVFAILIITTGYKILRASVAGIMDEIDHQLVDKIVLLLEKNKKEDWIDVHNLRVIKYGPSLHIDCHLTLPFYYDIEKSHGEVASLEQLFTNELDPGMEVFVHVDPCIEPCCKLCSLPCSQRKEPFQERKNWTKELIIQNRKHGLNQ